MSLDEYYPENMFRFDKEFMIQQVTVEQWELKYVIFQPISASACRRFLQNYLGEQYDYIPIMHPVRFPQSMFQDYKNIFGKGHRALLKSSP